MPSAAALIWGQSRVSGAVAVLNRWKGLSVFLSAFFLMSNPPLSAGILPAGAGLCCGRAAAGDALVAGAGCGAL